MPRRPAQKSRRRPPPGREARRGAAGLLPAPRSAALALDGSSGGLAEDGVLSASSGREQRASCPLHYSAALALARSTAPLLSHSDLIASPPPLVRVAPGTHGALRPHEEGSARRCVGAPRAAPGAQSLAPPLPREGWHCEARCSREPALAGQTVSPGGQFRRRRRHPEGLSPEKPRSSRVSAGCRFSSAGAAREGLNGFLRHPAAGIFEAPRWNCIATVAT